MHKKRLLFIVNVDWFFVSHRLPIAIEAIERGYEVHIATGITNKLDLLENMGLIAHPLNLHRSRVGVRSILFEFLEIFSIIRSVAPDVVHLVTIKPVLLGGLAARSARVPAAVFAVSGLGFVFINKGLIAFFRRKAISFLYCLVFGHTNKLVVFQNTDDRSVLSRLSHLPLNETALIHGSGVDLSVYSMQPFNDGDPVILLASRLLVDKGVREFVRAAEVVNSSAPRARFVLVGEIDPLNPATIQQQELDQWVQEDIVELWGHRDDMNIVFSSATIVVLPSYREGFPKVLIEAAASGRAVITTDVPGCRDVIENEVTGLLVPVRDAEKLADKISFLLDNPMRCKEMGEAGRRRAEEMFDVRQVVAEHMRIYQQLLSQVEDKQ